MIQKNTTFTIVMPVFLGEYKGAAKQREKKFIRAVTSVLNQTYPLWELIIISDGCEKSVSIATENNLLDDERVSMYKIQRGGLWDGTPRNTGIELAKNEYVIYLDADDEFMSTYLQSLADEMDLLDNDWYVVDDYIFSSSGYIVRKANINKLSECGTSNVIHKSKLGAYWSVKGGYAHDYTFINILKAKSKDYVKLSAVGYVVQHIPNKYDV